MNIAISYFPPIYCNKASNLANYLSLDLVTMASTYDHQLPLADKRIPRTMTGGFMCKFVHPPNRDLLQTECPVCLKVIREPHQVTCCGSNYCHTCIVYIKASKRPCPNCNDREVTSFPDIGLRQKLYVSKVHCSYEKKGCQWTGELGQLDEHLNTDPLQEKTLEGCQFVELVCTNDCGDQMQRKDIENHQNDHCPNRPFNCEHCCVYKATYNDVTQTHWPVCGSFPLSCPNKCPLILQRQNLECHIAKECPLTTINCDFHYVGCTVKLPRQDMAEHLKDNLTTHVSLLVISHAKQHDEIAQQNAEIVKQNGELKVAKAEIATLVEEKKTLQSKTEGLGHNFNLLTEKFNTSNVEQTRVSYALKEETMQLSRELTALKKQRRIDRYIAAGPQTTIPFSSPILALNNFNQRRKNIETWYSSPVYSHAQGYKLCLGVYTNIPKKYLSVFVHLMKGELDDSLKWPFRGAVWFRLLDQHYNEDHKCYMAVFDESVDPKVCSRVTDRERADKGWGKAMFLAHAELEPRYLQANTLLFQIHKVHVGTV